jgi:hypothetical protein
MKFLLLARLASVRNMLKVGVGLQIHIDDMEHAKYVENHVPGYLWRVYSSCRYARCLWRFSLLIIYLYLQFFLSLLQFLQAFVTQDVRDRDLLQKNLKSFEVPIINAREQNNRNAPLVTPEVLSPLKRSIRLYLDAYLNWFSVKGTTLREEYLRRAFWVTP